MRTVWKFDIESPSAQTPLDGVTVLDFEFPPGSVVLDVQVQHGRPVFWVDLQDENTPMAQRFVVIGTGWRIPLFVDVWEGTWQDGPLVWHLYSVNEALFQDALKRAE